MSSLKSTFACMAVLGCLAIPAQQIDAAPITIEFSEVALPQLTPLTGTNHYTPYGLFFEGSATYVQDPRFVGAGIDDIGITTTSPNIMAIGFIGGASSVTFDWATIASQNIFADAYDAGGFLLQSQSAVANGDPTYGSFTFAGIGTIAKVTFHDGGQRIGVGRLTFENAEIPEPASIVLLGLGAVGLIGARTRRNRNIA